MCHDLQYVVAAHSPSVVKDSTSTVRIVHFLAICKDQTFSRCNTPNQCHVVLLSSTCRSSFTSSKRLRIGKSKPPVRFGRSRVLINKNLKSTVEQQSATKCYLPTHTSFCACNAFSTGYSSKVNLIHLRNTCSAGHCTG